MSTATQAVATIPPDGRVCQAVFQKLFSDPSVPTFLQFRNTRAIETAHYGIPRAGHTNDILELIMGTRDQQKDYLTGLLVASITVLCFFLAWVAMLIVLKGLGSKRVGLWSGRRRPLPPKPVPVDAPADEQQQQQQQQVQEDVASQQILGVEKPAIPDVDADDHRGGGVEPTETKPDHNHHTNIIVSTHLTAEEWETLHKKKLRQQLYMKVTVLLASIVVIVMAIIMAGKGIQSLEGSLTEGQVTIVYAQELLFAGADLISQMILFLTSFQSDMSRLLNQTNTICPQVRPFLCSDIRNASTCDTTGVFPDGGTAFTDLITTFNTEWNFVARMEHLTTEIYRVADTAEQASNTISTFDWVFYIAVVFNLLVALLAVAMILQLLFGPRLPWSVRCLHHRLLFPTFIFFVLISFIFAIAFLIASLALSDTCVNNPDPRIKQIAEYFLKDYNDYIPQQVIFWLDRCDEPPPSIEVDEEFLRAAKIKIDEFQLMMALANDWLVNVCGSANTKIFETIVLTLTRYLCGAISILWDVQKAFRCSTWMPLYYNVVYNAMCYNGTTGVWAIAATQFTTTFMTCVILTFRCVFFDLEITQPSDPPHEEVAAAAVADEEEVDDEKDNDKNLMMMIMTDNDVAQVELDGMDDDDEKQVKNEKEEQEESEKENVQENGEGRR